MLPAVRFASKAACGALLCLGAPIGWAVPNPSPIQQQTAAAVVRDLGLDVQSGDIVRDLEVLAPFDSLPEGAAIHVVSARSVFAPGSWLLRLDCQRRRDCLPFDAVLRLSQSAVRLVQSDSATGKLTPPHPPRLQTQKVTPLARQGSQVELVEEAAGLRMRTRAVCLDSGALGERIRVENRATHRIVMAIVAAPDVVKVQP